VLAAADVGIAMGARGATAASETADVVILVDDVSRVVTAVGTARHTVRIARQSIGLGIGLSLAFMLVATTGVLPAVAGALVQEAIDVATILNGLRAGRGSREPAPATRPRPERGAPRRRTAPAPRGRS
jgi:cation transport ATPase